MTIKPEGLMLTGKLLKTQHIPMYVLDPDIKWNPAYDLHLRSNVFENSTGPSGFTDLFKKNVLMHWQDRFRCEYLAIRLPDERGLFIGPFSLESFTFERIFEIFQKLNIPEVLRPTLRQYYISIASGVSESWLFSVIQTLLESLGTQDLHIRHEDQAPMPKKSYNASPEPLPDVFDFLENRYLCETSMIDAIAMGNAEKAEYELNRIFTEFPIEQRESDYIRDRKNTTIILNTLCRKGAEYGFVHPAFLDDISSFYSKQIESCTTAKQIRSLSFEMINQYCGLVRQYSVKGYSPTIQNVVNHIMLDLSGNQSLKTLAAKFALSPSYLSNLFRKETGETLTGFVNNKRLQYAASQLQSTGLSIQDIAGISGIPDLNYFTKLFKRKYNMTPSAFREAGKKSSDDIKA